MSKRRVPPDKISKELGKTLDEFMAEFGVELSNRVIQKTPVRGGRLRGSIRLSKNQPEIAKDNPDPSGAQSRSQANSAKKSIQFKDEVFVTAGEDYAYSVEVNNTSFMRTSANEADQITKQVAKDL